MLDTHWMRMQRCLRLTGDVHLQDSGTADVVYIYLMLACPTVIGTEPHKELMDGKPNE